MTPKEIEDTVLKFKTRNKKGFTRAEIEKLLKKFLTVSQKRFFTAMGVTTVIVIDGEIIHYRSDIITALICCIENRDQKPSEFD